VIEVSFQPIDLVLDREDIAAEEDLDVLGSWFEQLRRTESELHTMVASIKEANPEAALGMARKLGYTRIALNWIRTRIFDLGGDVPDNAMESKYRRIKHHLTLANQQLEKRNKQVKELRAELEAAKAA